jgi:ankyrin repeat protein
MEKKISNKHLKSRRLRLFCINIFAGFLVSYVCEAYSIEKKSDLMSHRDDILFEAIRQNNFNLFKDSFRMEKCLEIDHKGCNLLHAAIAKGSLEITKFLLQVEKNENLNNRCSAFMAPSNSFAGTNLYRRSVQDNEGEKNFFYKSNSSPAILFHASNKSMEYKFQKELGNAAPIFILAKKKNYG